MFLKYNRTLKGHPNVKVQINYRLRFVNIILLFSIIALKDLSINFRKTYGITE